MLFLVLILVLAALGSLVTALITGDSLWAWVSIGLSLLAALALFVDWLRRRRAPRMDEHAAEVPDEDDELAEADSGQAVADVDDSTADEPAADEPDDDQPDDADEPDEEEPVAQPQQFPVGALASAEAEVDDEAGAVPAEEETDAADLLIVCELDDEVIVVDEHPRYHLAECGWLTDHDIIPIAVSEARELGFTPCVRCGPDAALSEKARKKRKKASWGARE